MVVVYAASIRLGDVPPIGRFLCPETGFWQNAVATSQPWPDLPAHLPLQGRAEVSIDARGVPHIFAQNDHDLYFLQGFLTARDRLWQMEFQTMAAAGRVSEVVGAKGIDYDLEQRRAGMAYAAEKSVESFASDPLSQEVMSAYTAGINAYMATLTDAKLPIEYKILDYRPEPWTPLKSALLLKHMAKMLTWTENDREHSALLKLIGQDMFNGLYPDPRYGPDPVAEGMDVDSTATHSTATGFAHSTLWSSQHDEPPHIGSNNWAVAGSRTTNGRTILCNDPHLRLMLPSIWYEVQLTAPGIRCRGVSLPGAPGIIIGFNDSIAWGVTNAGRDVKDYYRIEFSDVTRSTYRKGNEWAPVNKRVETIKVRGGKDVVDTVAYTHLGPVFIPADSAGNAWAMQWTAHRPSNEMLTFFLLNRARGLKQYQEALDLYHCPPQNFVYADAQGHIAIRQQGFYPLRENGHGRFLLGINDADVAPVLGIPFKHNPTMVDPVRGYVSSANQTAADSTYPYYYTGVFEQFRNRTINDALSNDTSVTLADMMALQLSDRNMLAEEALPALLTLLDTNRLYTEYEHLALNEVLAWDKVNRSTDIGATVFEIWWDELHNMLYDELNNPAFRPDTYYRDFWAQLMQTRKARMDIRDKRYVYPTATTTIRLLRDGTHPWFDSHFTPDVKETASDVVNDAFYWACMKFGDIVKYKINGPQWGIYKGTRVQHLLRLDAFSSPLLVVGGHKNAPNAMTHEHGPSWRMIVQPSATGPEAYGVYPGGQSGNPGHPQYLGGIEKWVNGEYYRLVLWPDAVAAEADGNLTFHITPK